MLEDIVEPDQRPVWTDFSQVLFIAIRAVEYLVYTYNKLKGSIAWNGKDAVLEIETGKQHTTLIVLVSRQPLDDDCEHYYVAVYAHRTLGGTRCLGTLTGMSAHDLAASLLESIREVTSYGLIKYVWYRYHETLHRSVWDVLTAGIRV